MLCNCDFCHFHLPNLSLTVCLSHINRKTQYENPVVEARRQKLLEQHQQPQPPEGERYIRGSFPALARHHFFLFFMSVSVMSFLSVYYFPGLRPGLREIKNCKFDLLSSNSKPDLSPDIVFDV